MIKLNTLLAKADHGHRDNVLNYCKEEVRFSQQ